MRMRGCSLVSPQYLEPPLPTWELTISFVSLLLFWFEALGPLEGSG